MYSKIFVVSKSFVVIKVLLLSLSYGSSSNITNFPSYR